MTPYQQGQDDALQLYKVAVRVPYIHGTSGKWPTIKPGVGPAIAANDPNARAVYVGTRNRAIHPAISQFAREATAARGGTPQVAHGKIDTQQGWGPRSLTAWGQKNVGGIDEMHDILRQLDSGITGPERGALWEKVQRGVGAWRNQDATTPLTPDFYSHTTRRLKA